jgi:hypothetical protein
MNRVSARQLVSAAKLAGSYGGIKVSALTNGGFLDTLHVLFDQDPGFSAVMKMFFYDPRSQLSERDYAATGQWTLRAPMLALSNPDPALAFPVGTVLQPQFFVRNTTSKPIDASLSFNWRTDTTTGKAAGPVLHLVPYETRRIDVAALQDGKTLPQNAQWTSVIMSTSGLPDEVVAVAASYDQSLHYGAQTPFSDQLAVQWEGGQWQYDAQHDSIITAGNGSSKPTQVAFTIFYNQGTQKYELDQTLQPGDQIWMDIGKLIRESVPDKNGNTLPANLTSGSYDVRDLSGTRVGTLFEGKVIYDKTYGHVTYGCAACCGWGIPYPWFNPLTVPITVHVGNGMWASYPCGNYIDDVSYNFYNNWTTGNTAIATYDSTGTALGVAPGSTSSQTHGYVCSNDAHNNCPLTYRASTGNINSTPYIASISPPQGLVGTAESVTINGAGFTSGATVNAASTISVSNVSVVSSTKITATFTPTNSVAAGGNQAFTVSINNGPPSNSKNFYVQAPTHLGYIDESYTPNNGHSAITSGTSINIVNVSGATVATGVCGGYKWVTYGLADQAGNRIQNGTVTFNESFSNVSPTPDPLNNPVVGPASSPNLATQVLGDTYAAYNPGPPACPPANVGDSFNQQWTATVGTVVYPLTTVISITRSTNSQGLPSFTSSITTP